MTSLLQFDFKPATFNMRLADILNFVGVLKPEEDYTLLIDKKKRPRSLRANNYAWTLTDKLADVMLIGGLKISKEEMHAEMIFRYGQPLLDEDGTAVMLSTAAKVKLPEFYPYAKEIGEGEVGGKTFKHYKVYRGSHTYTSAEMSVFIKGIVEECKEQGIPTETPEEIARMLSLMEAAENGG